MINRAALALAFVLVGAVSALLALVSDNPIRARRLQAVIGAEDVDGVRVAFATTGLAFVALGMLCAVFAFTARRTSPRRVLD